MRKLLKNLGLWILVAMVAGVIVGVAMGEKAAMFAPLGSLFIQLIKMLVVPLVGVSIISGAASLGSSRSAGKIGVTSIAYILFTTVISIVIAIAAGLIFKPGAGLSAEGIASIMSHTSTEQAAASDLSFWDTVIGMIPANPIQAFAEGNILQIIVFGLFLGFGIAAIEEQKRTKVINGLNYLLEAITGAGYELKGDIPCIYVQSLDSVSNNIKHYWVSVDSGLLVCAELYREDALIYRMSAFSPIQSPCPVSAAFQLPDGTVLHTP